MAAIRKKLEPGLYFVATPIGTARDITLRALDILASADVLAAEDTRSLRRLMDIHAISLEGRHIIAYHDHNGASQRPKIIQAIADGESVAYASEAGTPLIADPGFQLGREVVEAGGTVTTAPGASAAIAALTVSGLPSDRFLFAGFVPTSKGARQRFLSEFEDLQATLILYESPKRIHKLLDAMVAVFGGDRQVVIVRELTKKFEEVLRGSLDTLVDQIGERSLKGEIVVLVDRAAQGQMEETDLEDFLRVALLTSSRKDAVAQVSAQTGTPRRVVYQLALQLGDAE